MKKKIKLDVSYMTQGVATLKLLKTNIVIGSVAWKISLKKSFG